ncbi:MAG TPA: SOS response-associated peptidase, partial [Smithellaceae bacterium]|nr:SOS response-associated peptidase [Smithellaceae bacterium]
YRRGGCFMCGRFVLITDLSVIAEEFEVHDMSVHFSPSHTVSPGQHIPALIRQDNQNMMVTYLWGLIPSWAKDPSIGANLFNARAETVAEKPSFKNAFLHRRCLIPADGFYEWKMEGKKKIPYSFSLKTGVPFVFAGLHEKWIAQDKKTIETCTIITTRANSVVEPVHDRMPVIVPKESQALWLETQNNDVLKLRDILKPYPADELICKSTTF